VPDVDPRLDLFVGDVMGEASKRTGYTYKLGEGPRTPEQQARKVKDKVSWTYDSAHMHGRGRDLNAFDEQGNYLTDRDHPAYKAIEEVYNEFASKYPFRVKWGVVRNGQQVDPGHFEIDEDDGDAPGELNLARVLEPVAPDDLGEPERIQQATDRVTGATLALDDPRRETRPDASEAMPATSAPPALPQRESFDVRTMEGRAARDERHATERKANAFLELDVPLPSGVKDWSEATGDAAVRAGVLKFAASRGIPSEFVAEWMKKNGGAGFSLRDGEGKEVTPADSINADTYNPEARTLRVKLSSSLLSKLEDDFKASKGVVARARDYVTDDETSPGEKVLGVVGPPAAYVGGKVARGLDLATRPLQAIDAGFWAKVRGAHDVVALKTAYDQFFGEHPELGKNVIAEALRNSDRLKAINPRLPTLFGELANIILEPSNLIPLGALAKGAKLLKGGEGVAGFGKLAKAGERIGEGARGFGLLDRGIVEARPLGLMDEAGSLRAVLDSAQAPAREVAALETRLNNVLETARKIRAGEALTPEEIALHAEVRAKHAPNVAEHFDVEMRTQDGRRLLYSTETNELVDLETGELLDADAAKLFDAEHRPDAGEGGTAKGENSAIRNPQSPNAPALVPETPETLRAQLNALIEGRRAVVHVTPGEKVVVPNGFRSFKDFDGSRIIYDPRQVTHEEVVAAMDAGTLGELMGHVEPKPENPAGVVVAKDANTGTEIQSSYVSSEEKAAEQARAFSEQHPGARIEVGGDDLERQLLAEREAARPGVVGDVIRYKGRDIVRVPMPDGSVQGFYRSTGNNSKRAGEWFPFDEVGRDEQGEWFVKDRFSSGEMEDPAHPLHRLGDPYNRNVSEALGAADIKSGREVSTPDEVNSWLGGAESAAPGGDLGDAERAAGSRPLNLDRVLEFEPLAPRDDVGLFARDKGHHSNAPEWQQFPEESGSLNVPRASMPQIKSEHRGALVQFLKGRGITHAQEEVAPNLLRPSQAEFSTAKVEKALGFEGKQRSILVTSDGYVVDGHHQWLAALNTAPDTPIPVIRLDAPIQQTLIEAARFPSSGVDEASAAARSVGEAASGSPRVLVDDGKPLHEFLADLTGKPGVDADAPPHIPFARRVAYASLDTVDAAKSLFASVDASAAGRQAFFPLLFDTRATAKGLAKGLPSVFKRYHARFVEGLEKSALAHEAQEMGLALDSLTGARNEFFSSSIAEEIPGAGRVVSASDRVMTAQLDAVRLYNYQAWARDLRAAGMTPTANPEEFRSVARLLNIASGRGELSRVGQAMYPVTRRVIFSPKLLKSRFQVLNPLEYAGLPPAARRIALKKVGKLMAKFSGILGLAYLTADDVGLDPTKGNFLHARYGNTTYDLSGGEANKIRFVINLVKSVGATANAMRKGETLPYEETAFGVTSHFLRSQLAPGYSIIPDAATGKTYDGREFTWTEGVVRRITPGFAQDVYDGYTQGGGGMGALKALPSFVGIGTRTRDDEKTKKEWALAARASKEAAAKEKAAVSVASAPPHVRDELTRLKLSVPQLPKNISTEGLTGDSIQLHSKNGEQLAGLSDADFEKLKATYAAEVLGLLDETITNPDFDSFESDGDKRKYLDFILKEHRKMFLTGARREARERQLNELDKLEEYQRKLEGRSRQPKPGEHVKF
jgi:hypothetical protein